MALNSSILSVLLVTLLAGSALSQQANKCATISKRAKAAKLTLLLEALEAAGLTDLVDDAQGGNTILAPSDKAFTEALKGLKLTKEDLFKNKKFLTELLSYHILPTVYSAGDLATFGAGDSPFTTLLAGDSSCDVESVTVQVEDGTTTIFGGKTVASVISADVQACTSIIHVIDGVLVPCSTDPKDFEEEEEEEEEEEKGGKGKGKGKVVEEEEEEEEEIEEEVTVKKGGKISSKDEKAKEEEEEIVDDDYEEEDIVKAEEAVAVAPEEAEEDTKVSLAPCKSTVTQLAKKGRILNRAIQATGLAKGISDKTAELTIFAPTDAAFQALAADLGVSITKLLKDTDLLTEVLTFHILREKVTSDDIGKGGEFTTLLGQNSSCKTSALDISVKDGSVIVKGGKSTATVVDEDVKACASIIHFIDTVLVPCP